MKISEFVKESLLDYPGKISAVVFSPGCNYKCLTCHARQIVDDTENISEDKVFSYLDERKGWIDGIVLCGGEPTLQPDIVDFAGRLKKRGLAVKLDTNGSQFSVLQELRERGLVDYVAMDVKGPRELYRGLVGKTYLDFRDDVEKGMNQATMFLDYEFRTTVVPVLRNGKPKFMNVEEAEEMVRWVVKVTGSREHKYFVQKFVARGEEEMLDARFSKENLPEEMRETSQEVLEAICEAIKKHIPNVEVR